MNDNAQTRQWTEHLRDEAGALAQQQVAAGRPHGRIEGPLRHSRNDTAVAAPDAVLAERHRCAALAASFAAGEKLILALPDATPAQLHAAALLALHIAEFLRSGPGRPQITGN